jgi:hypothetical protein
MTYLVTFHASFPERPYDLSFPIDYIQSITIDNVASRSEAIEQAAKQLPIGNKWWDKQFANVTWKLANVTNEEDV